MHQDTSGICYAATDEGIELPVIDVTHPAFRLQIGADELSAAMEAAVEAVQRHDALPADERRAHVQGLLRESFLAPRISAAQGTVLSGMSTYFLKLGPENLGGYATAMDRTIAASMPCLSCRLRLQHMAHMTAEELAPSLEARPGEPLRLVNIAGGTGMDSLNALIVLSRTHPGLLDRRSLLIRILDVDECGPRFAGRALNALRAGSGPLRRLTVDLQYTPFDWSRPSALREALRPPAGSGGIVAGSSEGGLFEYASDEQIVGVLAEFDRCTSADAFLIGSVSRGDGPARILNEAGRAAIRLRTVAGFAAVAERGGWRISRVEESPLSWEVVLRRR
jgi:hypothetical protein